MNFKAPLAKRGDFITVGGYPIKIHHDSPYRKK